MRHRFLFPVLLLLTAYCAQAQTHIIDSLKQYVYNAANDKDKLKAILDLCEEHRSIDRDTLDYYSIQARELAMKVGDKRSKDLAELAVANTYFRWGWIDSALATLDPLLSSNPVNDASGRDLHFKMARQKALYFGGKSRFSEALAVLYQLVADAERYRDTLTIGANMNTIGSISLLRSAPRVALEWFSKALEYSTHDDRYLPVIAGIYANMGDAYSQLNKNDSAEYYSEKGVQLFRQLQNLSSLAITLQKQSAIYLKSKKLEKAEQTLKDMIEVRKRTNDEGVWVDDNISLIDFYLATKQVDKAIAFCKEALLRGNAYDSLGSGKLFTNSINLRLNYYEVLARCYKVAGKMGLYQQTLEDIIAAKDSFYMANSEEAIAEVQTKYEVQKKENTIVQQKLDIARNNIRYYLTLAGLFFIAVISYILFVSYRRREKLKMQLMLEIEKDISNKAVAKAEENERKRIAADLHDNLGAYAASIASNLDFIKRENKDNQEAVALQELHNNSRAIVSQLDDTIWALNKDELTLTAISDRLKIFARRIRPSYPHIEIEIEERIMDDISLPPTQAFHLFQVIQEAVVNALKHSGAAMVKVLLESDDHNWRISIIDKGKGMAEIKEAKGMGGNGLVNMKRRSEVSGWSVRWVPVQPSGTMIVIEH
jgi:two-component system NarL family sensor kinase